MKGGENRRQHHRCQIIHLDQPAISILDDTEGTCRTGIVSNARTRAPCRATVSEDTKADFLEMGNWHAFDYRCRKNREEKKDEGRKKQDSERCCWSEHDEVDDTQQYISPVPVAYSNEEVALGGWTGGDRSTWRYHGMEKFDIRMFASSSRTKKLIQLSTSPPLLRGRSSNREVCLESRISVLGAVAGYVRGEIGVLARSLAERKSGAQRPRYVRQMAVGWLSGWL